MQKHFEEEISTKEWNEMIGRVPLGGKQGKSRKQIAIQHQLRDYSCTYCRFYQKERCALGICKFANERRQLLTMASHI